MAQKRKLAHLVFGRYKVKMAALLPNLHKLAYGKIMNFFASGKLVFLNADLKSTQNSSQFSCVTHQNRTSGSRVTL